MAKSRKLKLEDLLAKDVAGLPEVTSVFAALMASDRAGRAKLAKRMHKLEATGDERFIAVVKKVADTFITPFDRDDLYQAVESLDDVIDQLDHASQLAVRFDLPDALPAELSKCASLLHEMSRLAPQMVEAIKKPKKMEPLMYEESRIENEMDQVYRDLLVRLVNDKDPLDLMKIKILADCIEAAATKLERFIRSVGVIAIKDT